MTYKNEADRQASDSIKRWDSFVALDRHAPTLTPPLQRLKLPLWFLEACNKSRTIFAEIELVICADQAWVCQRDFSQLIHAGDFKLRNPLRSSYRAHPWALGGPVYPHRRNSQGFRGNHVVENALASVKPFLSADTKLFLGETEDG